MAELIKIEYKSHKKTLYLKKYLILQLFLELK